MTLTIILIIVFVIIVLVIINNYQKKLKKLKEDNYCDDSKFVKFSAKTLRENFGMVEREYEKIILKMDQEIADLVKKTDIGNYIWKTHVQGFQFGGVREEVLVEEQTESVKFQEKNYKKYRGITIEELVDIVEKNESNIAVYKRKVETRDKIVKELYELRFGDDEYGYPRRRSGGMLI